MLHGRLMSNGNTWRSVLGAKSPTLPRKGGRMRGGVAGERQGWCASWRLRRGGGWRGAASRSAGGWVPRRGVGSWLGLMHEAVIHMASIFELAIEMWLPRRTCGEKCDFKQRNPDPRAHVAAENSRTPSQRPCWSDDLSCKERRSRIHSCHSNGTVGV